MIYMNIIDNIQNQNTYSTVNSIIDTHFDTLKWIACTTEDLDKKVSHLEGLN